MKAVTTITLVLILGISAQAQIMNVKSAIKNKAEQRVNNGINNSIDKSMDEAENAATNPKKKDTNSKSQADPVSGQNPADDSANNADASVATQAPANTQAAAPALKVYNNYDFKAGEKIIFEDNFVSDADGEFPAHWELVYGQGVVNRVADKPALNLTEGNYGRVYPLVKGKKYLGNEFTVEYDLYNNGSYPLIMWMKGGEQNDQELGYVSVGEGEATITGLNEENGSKELTSSYPAGLKNEFRDKWHHVAIAYKDKQIKVYIDQYRVCVMPNSGIQPQWLSFGGLASIENPLVFTNLKVAKGGGMNMLSKVETDGKIVTHGIRFDVNKAIIKPESMGTLNDIAKLMKDKPDLKFEIGGHTDNDGDDAANMKLSQERADAVKTQLVSMGIDAARLSAKGYGEGKPLEPNTSEESKANNRRVEFIKK